MKKIMVLMLVFLVTLLSSCGAESDMDVPQMVFYEQIQYSYATGSFNNTQPEDIFYGIHDYQKEFYKFYELARNSNDISKDLTVSEIAAYDLFFEKLELLDKHEVTIFEMDSNELKELFEANNIVIEAIDIFTFNSIKSVFDTVNDQYYRVTKQEFLEIILERNLTDDEVTSLEEIHEINNDLSNEYYEFVSLDLEFIDYIAAFENITGYTINETQKQQIELAYNLIKSIN